MSRGRADAVAEIAVVDLEKALKSILESKVAQSVDSSPALAACERNARGKVVDKEEIMRATEFFSALKAQAPSSTLIRMDPNIARDSLHILQDSQAVELSDISDNEKTATELPGPPVGAFELALQDWLDDRELNTAEGVASLPSLSVNSAQLGELAADIASVLGIALEDALALLLQWQPRHSNERTREIEGARTRNYES